MSDLRSLAEDLGFENVRTVLQSGNLIFEGARRKARDVETSFERGMEEQLGLRTTFAVRTTDQLDAVVDGNPFGAEAKRDPAHLLVAFLKDRIDEKRADALRHAIVGRERIHADGANLYIVYPDGVGRSKLTTALMEKHLGTSPTARNWNTILKLHALVT